MKKALTRALATGTAFLALLILPTGSRAQDGAREIEIIVDGGYRPDRITVSEGERVRLRFVRHEYSSCSREVVFPALNVRRELPPHQPIVIELPVLEAGTYEFRCGMNMIRGTIVVEAR